MRPHADQIGGLVISCGKGEVAESGRLYDETIGSVYPNVAGQDDGGAFAAGSASTAATGSDEGRRE